MMTRTATVPDSETSANRRLEATTGPGQDSGRVLDLIVERAWLLARRRAAWFESIGIGIGISDETTGRPRLAMDPDGLQAELEWRDAPGLGRRWAPAIAKVERALDGDAGSHLRHLAQVFGLEQPDLNLLQLSVAAQLDPSLGPAFGHLHGRPAQPGLTDALVRQLFGYGRQPVWDPAGPLAVWNLVRVAPGSAPGEPDWLTADPAVAGWLCGRLAMSARLGGVLRHVSPLTPLDGWPVDELTGHFRRSLEGKARLRVVIEGPRGSGRSTCAAVAASTLGVDCFAIGTGDIADEDWPGTVLEAHRLAVLGGFGLIWRSEGLGQRRWDSRFAAAPIQVVASEPAQHLPPWDGWTDHHVRLSEPSSDERRRLWQLAVPESSSWSEPDVRSLAERFVLAPGEIASIGGRGVTTRTEAAELAREATRLRLGDLGSLLDCPFTWDDIVLPEGLHQALRDLAFEACERVGFWENPDARRLFPRGTGLTALFNGSSGTGKTMATQVIAAELGLDLIRIDMARVVSKYIGETAKHLSQIFTRAARMSAILLFDEADALFARRTEVKDAHDRHANTDTSYLLQLVEEFRGVAVLTTNKKGNIDPAFLRRIRYVFEFPKPETRERRRIWGLVVRALAGGDVERRLSGTLDSLAGGTPVSGAQIKNAVLASVFIARRRSEPLSAPHLLAGLNRELSKEGRSVGVRERARLGSLG